MLYQTSTNAVRQDFQALIKQWWEEIGIATELRNIDASVFFGGDPAQPGHVPEVLRRRRDVRQQLRRHRPAGLPRHATRCDNEPRPDDQWQGENINRFCDPEYDALVDEMATTADLEERGRARQRLNDKLTKDTYAIIPLVDRGRVSAHANTLGGVQLNTWDSELWNVADWFRIDG